MSHSDREETIQGWISQLWPERRWQPADADRLESAFRILGDDVDFPAPGQLMTEFARLFTGVEKRELDPAKWIFYRKPRMVPMLGNRSTTIAWHPDDPCGEPLPSEEQRALWDEQCRGLPLGIARIREIE